MALPSFLLILNVIVSVIWQPDYLASSSLLAAAFQYTITGLISLILMMEGKKGGLAHIVNMLHIAFSAVSLVISAYGGYGIIVPLYNN
ncbi:hypothetical protein BM525_19045 (plasmid) [Alteromonas mediterranea]|uniref:Uncharacterized protein n=1 Tax=Alteromonas mediterranea TaxID=314275 RepID=A0AAC9NTT0_9ALTE|nr:hypothetical protein [Alteromonas mediterranea]APD91981.1 hypothetical protein BM524_18850 [Alteromonas mediterranea]APD99835.1 hypothetical protein BM525_19045 [Alteromonas mediterranea]